MKKDIKHVSCLSSSLTWTLELGSWQATLSNSTTTYDQSPHAVQRAPPIRRKEDEKGLGKRTMEEHDALTRMQERNLYGGHRARGRR
jgi:hypothetical protein